MKRISTALLQVAVVLAGIGVLAFMLWEPHLEGRNARATPFEIYFQDPFLAYAYLASLPFFLGLRHAFRALGLAGEGRARTPAGLGEVRALRRCALALIGLAALSAAFMPFEDGDDRPAGVFMRLLVIVPSAAVAAAAARFERGGGPTAADADILN